MFKFMSRTLIKGLAVVLPVAAATYVVFWLGGGVDRLMKRIVTTALPDDLYVPGSGVVVVIIGVFVVGLLMYPVLTRRLLNRADSLLRRIPLFASIYSPVRDLLNLLGGSVEARLGQVVLVKIPGIGFESLGFVPRETGEGLPDGLLPADHVVVLLPWSTQIGGTCFIVPKSAIRPVDLTVEEGLRWALTGGVSGPGRKFETPTLQESTI
jgi:uncharacterized membrane protein